MVIIESSQESEIVNKSEWQHGSVCDLCQKDVNIKLKICNLCNVGFFWIHCVMTQVTKYVGFGETWCCNHGAQCNVFFFLHLSAFTFLLKLNGNEQSGV